MTSYKPRRIHFVAVVNRINLSRLNLVWTVLFLAVLALPSPGQDAGILFLAKGYQFPYDLLRPEITFSLPSELREVSGIALIGPDRLAAIQDEKGNIYIVGFPSGKIQRKIDFADDGDYEDICLIKDDAWVLKSNGDLYRVKDFLYDKEREVKKYETDLSKRNDLEGLCHDPAGDRLLLAGKGHPFIDEDEGKHQKGVHAFDLDKKKLSSRPVYLIDLDELKYFRKYNTMTRLGIDLMANLDASKGDVTFQPSGISIHPTTKNIYIIGAVGDLLLVLHPSGEMLAMVELGDKLFNQPEGICFGPDGSLYISNEAGERKATLLRFQIKK